MPLKLNPKTTGMALVKIGYQTFALPQHQLAFFLEITGQMRGVSYEYLPSCKHSEVGYPTGHLHYETGQGAEVSIESASTELYIKQDVLDAKAHNEELNKLEKPSNE